MRQQTGSRNRGWLPAIGNRLSVAAGVALAVGMMAGTAYGWSPDYLATGGDVKSIYTNVAGVIYGVHSFTNVGSVTFTPTKAPLTVEYLVIGGGGGGGMGSGGGGGGGGGAGGYRSSVTNELSGSNSNAEERITLATTDPVAVTNGAGGAGATADLTGGTQGSPSSFGSIVAKGGGGGNDALTAGSGGGQGFTGGWSPFGQGWGTAGQGRDGGAYFDWSGSDYGGGGGGGASGVGGAGLPRNNTQNKGQGGLGLTNSITGTAVLRGGGGCGGRSGQAGAGGGGSAKGNGTDGTGGGGGGGDQFGGGGKGGSGIVIVRYVIPQPTVTVTSPTNNQVFAWNSSIAATATVANATVTSVDFQTNNTSISGPYGSAGNGGDAGSGNYTNTFGASAFPAGTNHIYAVMTATEGVFTSAVNAIVVKAAPSVYVTVPTSGQQYTAIDAALGIGVTAVVSNGVGPFTVEFFTNAVSQSSASAGTDSEAPYTRTLGALAANTSYEIYAVVTDTGNGNETATSVTNGFQVLSPDLAVIVSGPTEYPYGGTIACTATVYDAVGSTNVQFYTNSVAFGNEVGGAPGSTSPYGISFAPYLAPGTNYIYATAWDDSATATAAVHTVTVLAAPTVTLNTPTPSQQFAWNSSVTGTATCASGKTPYSVTFYTNKNGSAYEPAGTVAGAGAQTSFTNVLSSLGAGTYGIYAVVTDYYYSVATSWTNIFLVGGTLPTLSHRPPTLVTTGSATFNGFLSTTGNPSTYVYVLYGQNPNAWSFTNEVTAPVGGWTNNSPISTNIGSLAEGTYYYTIGASNGAPFNATTTASGTTNFITGEVTVQATDASAQHPGNNGQFTIYRPATCTNAALVVSYTLSGATVSPAGSATLNAGATSQVVTVAPSLLVGYSSNAVLTLTAGAGNYPYGTPVPNSATCTVLAADTTPTAPFWAWGGDSNFTITVSGRPYAVHMYTNVGTGYFIPSTSIRNVEYLVVGGGGGGACGDGSFYSAGGGGAGGLITSVIGCYSGGGTPGVGSIPNVRATLAASTTYNVTVGDGGAGSVGVGSGTTGQDSVFGNTGSEFARAKGGGGGGRGGGLTGGSGGGTGGFGALLAGGAGTVNQGFAGGGRANNTDSGGGGGGAGNVGQDSTGAKAGDGGAGLTNNITGSSVVYAGGGGGVDGDGVHGGGGDGGGAAGGSGADGSPKKGGGGGARITYTSGNGNGGIGGSGIVIVRYDISPPKGTLILMR